MDIRQIQALHAQYASQPVVIDIAGHVKAMPALPAPDANTSAADSLRRVAAALQRAGKPAAIIVAVAALAAGGGISAAKLWKVIHTSLSAPTTLATSASSLPQATVAQAGSDSDSPINAAPPRPLTASDFGGRNPEMQSALSNVDAHALIAPRTPSGPQQVTNITSSASGEAGAAASPIRMVRPTTASQPVSPAPVIASAQANAQASASAVAPGTQQAQPVNQPDTDRSAVQTTAMATPTPSQPATVAIAPATPAKPALRQIRRITAHHSHEAGDAASTPGTPAQTPAPAASAGNRPATAGKSGDVQLF
ncbi:hypothetical protein [Paraburkholderia sp. BL10I2N1]|uniref:hypothetical protein n=1 Tax=Paraburkholderia sp. BL10I2N1 TaxID=1938796 RepID=UPI00105D014C|nr:hypothetical protein [Paraburkholderia sp. BL10I2N1]TDN59014.1 hypothetical protein B0G77_8199 [Paraburkholderia sp. BL10I2N1]